MGRLRSHGENFVGYGERNSYTGRNVMSVCSFQGVLERGIDISVRFWKAVSVKGHRNAGSAVRNRRCEII